VYTDTVSLSILSVAISLFSARAAESIARKSIVANLIASKEASSTQELVEAMLPRFVVDSILAKGTSLIADEYPNIAIMFLGDDLLSLLMSVELHDFGRISSSMTSPLLLQFVNAIESALAPFFSGALRVLTLETSPPMMCCVSGLTRNGSDMKEQQANIHAVALVAATIQSNDFVLTIGGVPHHLKIRVGAHCGPATAGVSSRLC
jgi:hypothetical protein